MTTDDTFKYYVLSKSDLFANYAYGCITDLSISYFMCNASRHLEICLSQGWLGNGTSSGYCSHPGLTSAAKHHGWLPTEPIQSTFSKFSGLYLLPQHAGAHLETVKSTPCLLLQAVLSREKRRRIFFYICIILLSVIQSCELAHHRLLLIEHEGHLNKINTLGLGYANVSPTQALPTVRGFHTDAMVQTANSMHRRGIRDKTHFLAYFRHSGCTILFSPWIFFLYYGSLCMMCKSFYLVQSSVLMPPLMHVVT